MRGVVIGTVTVTILMLSGCAHYPPTFSPARGQTTAQQEADARDCDRQVHGAGRTMTAGALTAWSEKERDEFVACMQGRGYTADKR